MNFAPVSAREWQPGDYRESAFIDAGACSFEELARRAGATVLDDVEEGLGPCRSFSVRSTDGRQVGFICYAHAPTPGTNILALFENGRWRRSDVERAVVFLGVPRAAVTWLAPGADDV
jgi:hypothetical protein